VGREWLVAHRKEYFGKTALMVNCEHPATLQTYVIGSAIKRGNTYTAQQWYAGGPSRPKLQELLAALCRDTSGIQWIRLHYAYPRDLPDGLFGIRLMHGVADRAGELERLAVGGPEHHPHLRELLLLRRRVVDLGRRGGVPSRSREIDQARGGRD